MIFCNVPQVKIIFVLYSVNIKLLMHNTKNVLVWIVSTILQIFSVLKLQFFT